MSKSLSRDILDILELFQVLKEPRSLKSVSSPKFIKPDSHSFMYSFEYLHIPYVILFHNQIDEDQKVVMDFIPNEYKNKDSELVLNPTNKSSYGVPYKGKTTYLLRSKPLSERLDIYLTKLHPELSRALVQKYIKSGLVKVNNKVVDTSKVQVGLTDKVSFALPKQADHTGQNLDIIYEDENVVVIDKPVGLLSHSKGALNDEFTVSDFFKRYSEYNKTTNRPGVVHRLDRDTSGVMLGAKNEQTAKFIQKQFSDRSVKKTYYAIVKGHLKLKKALIDLPIERDPTRPSRFKIGVNGKSARTVYEVISSSNKYSLVRLEPQTGRTHQLRVHMSHIGHPIIGDRVYGNVDDRLYLHAARLELTLPGGERKTFESNLPKSFMEKIKHDS